MEINELFSTILMIICSAKLIQGADSGSKPTKWILLNKYLYFIEVKQEFTSHEAQLFCVDNDMSEIIETSELMLISKVLLSRFAHNPSLWTLEKDFSFEENTSSSICFALAINGIYSAQCGSLKGVICKTEIYGGTLQYKNGTYLDVGVDEVNRLCNPNLNKYDELLEYCMIKFYQQLS